MTTPDDVWAALGDPTRLEVLNALLRAGSATASRLADDVPVTRQAVTKHLVVLEAAGLVARARVGREVVFTVQDAALERARRRLADIAAEWDRRLADLKDIAEGRDPRGSR